MIHDNAVVGSPLTLYKDTKANIEAISSPVEGMQAFASDTPRQMFYTGSAWKLGLLSDFDNDGLYWDSSNVRLGIGATPTTYDLEVFSTGATTLKVYSSGATENVGFRFANGSQEWRFYLTNNNNIVFRDVTGAATIFSIGNAAPANSFVLLSSGNIIIGGLTDGLTSGGSLAISQDLAHRGSKAGFYNTTPITKPTVSGARDESEGALASLLTALSNLGLITNSTTAS